MIFNFGNWCPAPPHSDQVRDEVHGIKKQQPRHPSDKPDTSWWRWQKSRELSKKTRKSNRKKSSEISERDGFDQHQNESTGEPRINDKSLPKNKRNKSSDVSFQSEGRVHRKREQDIFRERDAPSVRSEPLPTSILAESFYSDDSLDNGDLTYEVDYWTSTPLFEALEENDWSSVLFFLRTGKFFSNSHFSRPNMDDPDTQVRTWVHCQDSEGGILWRKLPLHAAVCLSAPLRVIQRIVEMYPEALRCQDSFGNFPHDLATKLNKPGSYVLEAVRVSDDRSLHLLPSQDVTCESNLKQSTPRKTDMYRRQHTYSTEESFDEDDDGGEVLAIVDDDEFELYYY